MFSQPGMGYDRAITIFSPDGRLFQVEYAIEAVRRGTTAIVIRNKDSVVFAVEKRIMDLQEEQGSEKIFKIDGHLGAAIAGLTADARVLIDKARVQAQVNILSYDEKISVRDVTQEICDTMQVYTQNGGIRPFGVSLLLGGIDPKTGPKIFMTDPSGAFWGYFAAAIGSGQANARQFLEKEYKNTMTFDQILELSFRTLKEVLESDLTAENCSVAYIKTDEDFTVLTKEKKKEIIKKIG